MHSQSPLCCISASCCMSTAASYGERDSAVKELPVHDLLLQGLPELLQEVRTGVQLQGPTLYQHIQSLQYFMSPAKE